ncbi:hypothetical protein DH09_21430 [Bacillaceae bacterium JMAK1]|nr:hypothetical protein DH09_21430 [Bacillaceae bacterium JMAK1]
MMDETAYHLGEVVCALKGKDAGNHYIVVSILDVHFVRVADGDGRRFQTAKKKNVRHLRKMGYIASEVKNSLEQTDSVTNAKIRHGLIQYCREKPVIIKEGE